MSGGFKDLWRPLSLLPSLTGNIKDNGCSLVLDPGGGNKEHHPQTTQFQEIKIVTSCSTLGSVCYHDAPWCILTDALPFPGLTHGVCPGSFWEGRWRGFCELGQPQGLVTFLECLPTSLRAVPQAVGQECWTAEGTRGLCLLLHLGVIQGVGVGGGGLGGRWHSGPKQGAISGLLLFWGTAVVGKGLHDAASPTSRLQRTLGNSRQGASLTEASRERVLPSPLSLGPDCALVVGHQARHQAERGSWEKDGACWAQRTHSRPHGTEQGAPGPP